jgi:Mg2+ and Co2+ transporter CorA
MNFEYIPELNVHLGYFIAVGVMFACILVLHRFFKRINWL